MADKQRVETTFWMDFTIADAFGLSAIQDTFDRAFNEWKDNYKYLTELSMVLNNKVWEMYEKHDDEKQELYDKLFYQVHGYAYENLKGDELRFYYEVTN